MNIEKGKLKDCWIMEPDVFEDARGFFYEGFNSRRFEDATGVHFQVKQINQSRSSYGVLRGLHFQSAPKAQAKFISVLEGEVIDVAVDLRKDSETYMQYELVRLSSHNKKHFYIPKGMAHGFLVISDQAKLMYQVDEYYSPEHDSGIRYDDPSINITWGFKDEEIILSEKDRVLPYFQETEIDF
jgi:dTDP-4-dehydrorhamnose 3,5-epimerase